jgi:hypothetical protein
MRTLTIAILFVTNTLSNLSYAQTNAKQTPNTNAKEQTEKPAPTERKAKLTRFTEIHFGINNTTFPNTANANMYSDNAFQIAITKRHQLASRLDLSYGAAVVKVNHQMTYLETKDKFQDVGERGYNTTYFRVPVDLYYEVVSKKPHFITAGVNVNSSLLNYSAESFTRINSDNTAKEMWKYRETALLDLGLRIGVGTRMQVGTSVVSMTIAYNQGTIVKDMGLKQRQIECMVSMSIPKKWKIKGMGTSYKSNPAPWLN